MRTNAPQIPVKIITALWFSILTTGILPNQSQNKNIKKGLQRAVDGHRLSCLIAMIIPQKERDYADHRKEHSQIPGLAGSFTDDQNISNHPENYQQHWLHIERKCKKEKVKNSWMSPGVLLRAYYLTPDRLKDGSLLEGRETHMSSVSHISAHPLIQWIRLVLISRPWAPWMCHFSLTLTNKEAGLCQTR